MSRLIAIDGAQGEGGGQVLRTALALSAVTGQGFEIAKIRDAGAAVRALGMRFNAGHALNYFNVQPVASLPGVGELHIGHAIVSRSLFVGLREAVRQMKALIREAAVRFD